MKVKEKWPVMTYQPLNYVCTEVNNAMAEFDELFKPVSLKDTNSMIYYLNNDELRIFNKLVSAHNYDKICT